MALGTWIGFGLADITSIVDLGDVATGVGLWIGISGLISFFFGAFVASWLAGSRTFMNGMWHGLAVWGFTLALSVFLGTQGVHGILGFAMTPSGVFGFLPGVSPADAAQAAADVSADFAGWFFMGSMASLAAAVFGGWLGTYNRGSLAEAEFTARDEMEERRAA
jgi:hypothetical protein